MWAAARLTTGNTCPNFGCLGVTTCSGKFTVGHRLTLLLLGVPGREFSRSPSFWWKFRTRGSPKRSWEQRLLCHTVPAGSLEVLARVTQSRCVEIWGPRSSLGVLDISCLQ